MKRIKNIIITVLVMALVWWLYVITDMYMWGAHQILNGILVVIGMMAFGGAFYILLSLSESDLRLLTGRRKKESWETEWQAGQWQR